MKTVRLGDCIDIEIRTGIMPSRIIAKEGDEVVSERHIINPNEIQKGFFAPVPHPTTKLKTNIKDRHLTKEGDLIIQLCGPYNCAMITSSLTDMVVPSFCATIRCSSEEIDKSYLLAFFNNSRVEHALRETVKGKQLSNAISVHVLKDLTLPIPSMSEQIKIGKEFNESVKKIDELEFLLQKELLNLTTNMSYIFDMAGLKEYKNTDKEGLYIYYRSKQGARKR